MKPATETPDFLAGGGELGARLREMDWNETSLGSPHRWPQSLKTAVRIMLTSRQPMFVWWGPELINLYNDAYKAIVGGKHPEALGQPASVVWREIWAQVGPRAEHAITRNEGTYDESLLLIMERNGYPEETYYTFSYSPIPADEGGNGGIICANTDDTQRIIGERQLNLLRELAAQTVNARTFEDACALSARSLETNPRDLPFALIYLLDSATNSLHLAGSAGFGRHIPPPARLELNDAANAAFAAALEKHQPVLLDDLSPHFGLLPCGAWEKPPEQAAIVPIAASGETGKSGVLVAGLNPYRLFDDSYSGFINLVAGQIAASIGNAQAYEEERKRAEALAELDRAKTVFFSNVSHEFRTPLTLMLGPLEDLLGDHAGELTANNRETLTVIQRNGQRLLKLVNTLLDFSRIEAGRTQAAFEPVDLAGFTADLASVFRAAVERAGMRLIIDCPPLSEPAYVDREMWEKIVLNLLSNAFKYTLEGEIRVTVREQDGQAQLSVQDTGTGIPEAELPKLFNRFHRVEGARGRTHEGTGIGLALVQELARMHGGSVEVQSTLDRGSTFTISVPLGNAHLAPDLLGNHKTLNSTALGASSFLEEALRWLPNVEQNLAPLPAIPTPEGVPVPLEHPTLGPRSLIVLADDNADMREYVQRLLSTEYEVIAVADGEAALETARRRNPDLVLTDVMMPKLDGFGLLRALRTNPQTAPIPIIMLSARAGEEARVEGLEAGADDYLIKPFSARELLARVGGTLALSRTRREALRREEELRAETTRVLESISQGFIALDKDFRLTYVNAEAEKLLNVQKSEILGKSHWEAFPASMDTQVERVLRQVAQDRLPATFENYYVPLERWFQVWVYPARREGISVYFRDITKQKLTEIDKNRFASLVENSQDFIGISDLEGHVLYLNSAALKIMGLQNREQAQATRVWDYFFPEDQDFIQNQFLPQVLRDGQGEVDIRVRNFQSGEEIWMSYNVLLMRDADGKPAGYGTVSRDITERRLADRDRKLLASIVESSEDAIISKNLNGIIMSWNKGAERIFGYTADEVIGRPITILIPPENQNEERMILSRLRRGERIETYESIRVTKDGRRLDISLTISPIRDESGRFVGASKVARDITERKRAEQMLKEADRRKDEFLATLAHELRNPLAPIRNGLQIMQMAGDDRVAIDKARAVMERQLKQMVRLIDDLLDLSRISRGKVELRCERLNLATIVQSAIETSRPLIDQSGHHLHIDLPTDPIFVHADMTRLAQVFSNLLNNAAKYTERGGNIWLSVRRENAHVAVSIRDNGIGIPPAMLPRIFEMFTQVDQSLEKSHGGLGIGLNIVQKLVEMHEGTVTATSAGYGHGSEFTVELPMDEEQLGTSEMGSSEGTQIPAGPRRILVADDNADIAESLALLLEMKGNEVRLASDGQEAVEMAAEYRPDVILLDIGMPRLNGYEACRQIRQQPWGKNTVIFALTGWGQEEDLRKSREAGFNHHLVKPVEPMVLFKMLPPR